MAGPLEGHNRCVNSIAVSPDDRQIASGGDDNAIIIWDVDSKPMVLKLLVKHASWVSSVCFSPNGKRLASGSLDDTVIIWDVETGAVLSTLKGQGPVYCVTFSPNGLKLASGALRNIRVWSTDNAEPLLDINAQGIESVVWSPDSQHLISASYDKTIKFCNSSYETWIGPPCTGHTAHIRSLAVSSDDSFVATALRDMTVRLWSTKSHQQIGEALKQ